MDLNYEKLFNSLCNITNDGFFVWDIPRDYEYMSPRFKEILGFEDHEMENHPSAWKALIFKEDMEIMYDAIGEVLKHGGSVFQKVRYRHKQGHTVYVICRATVVEHNEHGSPTIVAGTHTDITNLENTRMALEQETRKLNSMCDNKSIFIARMNHEIRSPLNAILGFMELIKCADSFEEIDEHVDWVIKAGGQMLNMANEVIDISEIELTGVSNKTYTDVDIIDLILEDMKIQTVMADVRKVDMSLVLVPSDLKLIKRTDRTKMRQIFTNLLNNAIKYNKKGGSILITVSNDYIMVTDTGVGISKENQEELFKPFTTFSTCRNNIQSSGIGLNLVKKLCQVLNYSITCESTFDEGTTFKVLF